MSSTFQRNRTIGLARTHPGKALLQARATKDPWFRAQALSWVARFWPDNPVKIAAEAAGAAQVCENDYKKSAVRAWEIAALAERGFMAEARKALAEALALAGVVQPPSSRCDALSLLLDAAFRIGPKEFERVRGIVAGACSPDCHWRCKRTAQHAERLASGTVEPRQFYW